MDKIKFDFNNRTAVITGGAQGFGLDIAQRFLKSGAKVIIWDIDPKLIDEAKKELGDISAHDMLPKIATRLYITIFENLEKSELTPENKILFMQNA